MKKVGIFTLPLINNYGGILQTYALQCALRENNIDAVFIDYRKDDEGIVPKFKSEIKNLIKKKIFKNKKLVLTETKKIIEHISINSREFIECEINPKTKPVYTNNLATLNEELDAFIVGSDQVWRKEYTPNIKNYFFDFVTDDKPKLSYAASFGKDDINWDSDDLSEINILLDKFKYISVREDAGVKIVEQYFKKSATHSLDPTFLLNKNKYIELINKYKEDKSNGDLFCYILDESRLANDVVSTVSKRYSLIPFKIKPEKPDSNFNFGDKSYIYPRVTKWLRAFLDAKYIVVDSFHGCVFSIIFNKPFIAIGNKQRGLARFTSLLSMFDLNKRLIIDEVGLVNFDFDEDIDWDKVNRILIRERSSSLNGLIDAMKYDETNG